MLRKLFSQHWFGLLALLFGLFTSIYFYRRSIAQREPNFVVEPGRLRLIDSTRIGDAPVRILRRDGSVVNRDLSILTFYFWNSGRLPIRGTDVLDKLRISLADTSCRILDAHIIYAERPVTEVRLALDTGRRQVVYLDFRILEVGDGLVGQIVYEGNPTASLRLAGVIEGVHSITTPESVSRLSVALSWTVTLFVFLGAMIGVLLIVGVLLVAAEKIWPDPQKRAKVGAFAVAGLGVLCASLIALAVIKELGDPQLRHRSERLIDRVPLALRSHHSLSP